MSYYPYSYTIFRRTSIFSGQLKQLQTTPSLPINLQQCHHHHYHTILPLCNSTNSLQQTKQSHAIAILAGILPYSVTISSAFILQYATFGNLSTSLALFHQSLPYSKSAFLFNTVIRAHSIAGVHDQFRVYNLMIGNGVRPDDHTFPFVLKACSDWNEVSKGFEVHGLVFKLGFDSDLFVGNTLLRFYGECCGVEYAEKVFDDMPERDVVSWNTLIAVFSVTVCYDKAVYLFSEMRWRSVIKPNVVTIVTFLPVCAAIEDTMITCEVHNFVVKMGFGHHVTINNAFIDAYGKCGDLKACKQVFDEMVYRNDVSYNAVITSYAHLNRQKDAIDFFWFMINEGITPNTVAVSSMLPILTELEFRQWGIELHGFSIRKGMESDIFVANSLLDMYAKFRNTAKASKVFNNIHSKNIVSWNTMVANYAQNGLELLALQVVREMQDNGEIPGFITLTNVLPACARIGIISHGKQVHAKSIRLGFNFQLIVSNALIDMYAKCGGLNLARNIFNVSYKDIISYNTLISAYSHTNSSYESLVLFRELLLKGLEPDSISFSSALSACANSAEIRKGMEIHGVSVRTLFHNHLIVSNSVLDLYTKCGRMDLAKTVFDKIPNKDIASWNTIIMGYGLRGDFDTAISLFESVKTDKHVKCDSITFIVVLSICGHGGLVDLGRKYFEELKERNIEPTLTHYACLVDLLGRAGLINEAVQMVSDGLPNMEPDAGIWGSILGACRIHGNVELARWAAEHLFQLKPGHSGYYTLLSNMYAEAGRWNEADEIREMMKFRGVRKNPGFSSIQQAGKS